MKTNHQQFLDDGLLDNRIPDYKWDWQTILRIVALLIALLVLMFFITPT